MVLCQQRTSVLCFRRQTRRPGNRLHRERRALHQGPESQRLCKVQRQRGHHRQGHLGKDEFEKIVEVLLYGGIDLAAEGQGYLAGVLVYAGRPEQGLAEVR